MIDLSKYRSFDTETLKFRSGEFRSGDPAPRIVCASTAEVVSGETVKIRGQLVYGWRAALDVFRQLLRGGYTVLYANAAYDLAVAAQHDPALLAEIFRAIEEERVHDILIAQSLDAIFGGHLGLDPRTGQELRHPDTGKSTKRYSLAICTDLVLGRADAKKNDVWRESYGLLEGFPVEEWPYEARQYPVDDAENTLEVGLAQIFDQPGAHAWQDVPAVPGVCPAASVCRHCGLDAQAAGPRCAKAPRVGPHRNLGNLSFQVAADFAYKLGAAHGLRTDPEKVAELGKYVEEKYAVAVARFQKKGWIREDGSEDEAAVKRAIALAYGARGTCSRCRGGVACRKCDGRGAVDGARCEGCGGLGHHPGKVRSFKVEDCRGEKVRGRLQGCKFDGLGGHCGVCGDTGKVKKVTGEKLCKNVFDENEVLVEEGCDGTGLDLSQAKYLDRTKKMGVKTDRDTKMESGDEDLSDYGEDEHNKARTTYYPYLLTGVDGPLYYSANVIVATGRGSLEHSSLHQMPRQGRERGCLRARGAWCGYPLETIFGSTDYEAGELCLDGDTRILTDKGYLPLRELLGRNVRVASKFSDENSFVNRPRFHKATAFRTGIKKVIKIITVDGREIVCTHNHPVLVQTISGKRDSNSARNLRDYGIRPKLWRKISYKWVKAGEVVPGDLLVSGSVSICEKKPRLDSKFYTLGHFLGDGWMHPDRDGRIHLGVCAGGHERFILDNVRPVWDGFSEEAALAYPVTGRYSGVYRRTKPLCISKKKYRRKFTSTGKKSVGVYYLHISRKRVVKLLQEKYGFKCLKGKEKRFPSSYWKATPDQKRSFLRGLFDADGSIVAKPRRSVSFTAANRELARDVLVALSEFGIDARLTTQHVKSRRRSQTILQIRGVDECERVAKHVLFEDKNFRSVKAERLTALVPKERQSHYHGMKVLSVEPAGTREVFNLEVPATRHYVAEGLVVHNCSLAQWTYWLFGYSQMRDAINKSGKPGILHSDLAAQVMGISLDEFLVRLKAKDKTAVDFRQASKPYNFGKPAGMGTPNIVATNRKKSAGFTVCEGGPAENADGQEGYWGIRFCVLIGGAKKCGVDKILEWGKKKPYRCAPVCKACCDIVQNVLEPAYFTRYPEIRDYFTWVGKRIDAGEPALSCVWDAEAQRPRIVRERGGCDFSAFANNAFQSLLADVMKAAFVRATKECYLGVKEDGSPSPLGGCRLPLVMHDEPLSELILDTAHLSGPRIAEIMVEAGRKFAPHVVWKAETSLGFWYSKKMEPVYDPTGKLSPWGPVPDYLQSRFETRAAA